MNDGLAALIRLQKSRDGIAALTVRIEKEIPARVSELEVELRVAQERFEKERAIIEATRKERTRLDLELKVAEENISRYKAALMKVKNNDEYRAALNEIDYTQRTYGEIEARMLELMEAAESGEQELGTLEAAMKIENDKIQADRQVIAAECEQLTKTRAKLDKAALVIEQEVPGPLLVTFQRLVAGRHGQALAAVGDGICGCCNMRLRPAVYQQVKRNEQMTTCDSCRRILYYVRPEEATEETATGTNGNARNDAVKAVSAAAATPNTSHIAAMDTTTGRNE